MQNLFVAHLTSTGLHSFNAMSSIVNVALH